VALVRRALRLPSRASTANDEGARIEVQMLIDTLSDEEWFTQIRNWRDSEFGTAVATRVHLDGATGRRVERDRPNAVEHPAWAARVHRLEDPLTPVSLVADADDAAIDLRDPPPPG
jgi:hypothetical protein